MEDSVVIVRSNRLNLFGDIIGKNIKVLNMFSEVNKWFNIAREICLFTHINLSNKLFNEELINMNVNTIIIFDGHVRKEFLEWIIKYNPNSRIILWLWNSVKEIDKNFSIYDVPKKVEIWSYSKHDCKKYNLNYNTTFFWKRNRPTNEKIKNDIFFIGKDKGRYKKIKSIEQICKISGLRTDFIIVASHKWTKFKHRYSKPIPYSIVNKKIAESKAILDVVVDETAGPSLRALEASFLNKKLITDATNVVDFKFYNSDNILIIDNIKSLDDLKNFLEKPFIQVDQSNVEYYYVDEWIKRF